MTSSQSGWTDDLYFKKRLNYALRRRAFQFDAGELLFSTYEVDSGTQFLLRYLLDNVQNPASVLDLGCGYGVLGIVLANFLPHAHVTLSDKDLLAVRYTRHNLQLNQIENAEAVGSLAFESLPATSYDLIVSNVPGHIGEAAIELDFILEPARHLSTDGEYWLVIVAPLAGLIEQCAETNGLKCQKIASRPAHTVYKITLTTDFAPPSDVPTSDPYLKTRLEADFMRELIRLDTAALVFSPFKIDDGTLLYLKALEKFQPEQKIKSALILNAGYGTTGIASGRRFPKADIYFADRDLLALRYSRHNSELNGLTNSNFVPIAIPTELPDDNYDLICATLPPKIPDVAIEQHYFTNLYQQLSPGGSLWLVAEVTVNRMLPALARQRKIPLQEIKREGGFILYRAQRR